MKRVNVFKANPVISGEPIESVTIVIDSELPYKSGLGSLSELRQVFTKEAKMIVDAMCKALPQGTVDAVIAELLERKRSLFIVPMETKD